MVMAKAGKLSWTPNQIKIAQLLQEGGHTKKAIAVAVGLDPAMVTKVDKALKNGQIPPEIEEETPAVEEIFPDENQGETGGDVPPNDIQPSVNKVSSTTSGAMLASVKSATSKAGIAGVASVFKFVQVPIACPITSIMMNARFVAESQLGWPKNMSWEDFFDTVLYHYFKAMGYTIQGFIIDKQVEDVEAGNAPPVPVSENHGGNGSKIDIKELAKEVGNYLIAVSQQEVN